MTTETPRRGNPPVWPWIVALCALAIALQGVRPLWDPDEGRYSLVALRMLRTGDWLTPTLHPEVVHFTKPPLFYWLMAGACWILGASEWAVRLPTALAFAGTVLLVARIARRLLPGRETTAGIVHATSLLPFVASCVVTTDTLLTFWETLALAAFVEWRWGGAEPRWRWTFWLALAAAFLTKGPPGLVPVVAILAFVLWERLRGPSERSPSIVAPGPLLSALVVALGWYAFEAAQRPELVRYWLRDEVLGRIVSSEYGRNPGFLGLFDTYLPVVLLAAQPWLSVVALRRGGSVIDPRTRRFLLAWLLAPGVVFALADSRLPLYLLPLAPAASLLIAARLPERWGRRGALAIGAWAILLVAMRGAGALVPETADGKRMAALVARALPSEAKELVFFDSRPHYSLSFYLGAEVEWVRLNKPAGDPEHTFAPLYDSLDDELDEAEPGRYFLVTHRKVAVFLEALERRGYHAQQLGDDGQHAIFTDPDKPAVER